MVSGKKTILNVLSVCVAQIGLAVCAFLIQHYFAVNFGKKYVGLNGLFSSIVSLLSLAELGIGSAFIGILYQPLHNKDYQMVNHIMHLFKKTYGYLGALVLTIGLLVELVIPMLVKNSTFSATNLRIYFFIYLLSTVIGYFFVYNQALLNVAGQSYIENNISVLTKIGFTILQIIQILSFKNYPVFLMLLVLTSFTTNVLIFMVKKNKYPWLSYKVTTKLPIDKHNKIVNQLKSNVKGTMLVKLCESLSRGFDTVFVSNYLGILAVGEYTSYMMLINFGIVVLNQLANVFSSYLAIKLINGNRTFLPKVLMINFGVATLVSGAFYSIIAFVIKLWLGADYLLTPTSYALFALIVFFETMKVTPNVYTITLSIFNQVKFYAVLEVTLNVIFVFSYYYLISHNLNGILIGRILAMLLVYPFRLKRISQLQG